MDDERREWLKKSLRTQDEQSLDARVDRYLFVNHQWVTGNHSFAYASAECLETYRDGHFLSCVMATQAVLEGIIKFVVARNSFIPQQGEDRGEQVRRMYSEKIVSLQFVEAVERIRDSFRNDYHHMNPGIAKRNHPELAKRNIIDLATIERELFECLPGPSGSLVPKYPKYWDIAADGSVPVFVRL